MHRAHSNRFVRRGRSDATEAAPNRSSACQTALVRSAVVLFVMSIALASAIYLIEIAGRDRHMLRNAAVVASLPRELAHAHTTNDPQGAVVASPPRVGRMSNSPSSSLVSTTPPALFSIVLPVSASYSSSQSRSTSCSTTPSPSMQPSIDSSNSPARSEPSVSAVALTSNSYDLGFAAESRAAWEKLWSARTGPVDPEYHAIIRGIVNSVAGTQEWDKGWMLLLQALMRRRSMEWYTDPASHGGRYIRDAAALESRLRLARSVRDCHRDDTTIVAAVMVRGEGRYVQEWLTWHLYVGYSHIVVFYEDPTDGTLDVIQPFVGASLVTAIHTPTVPGVRESMAALKSQVFRQRLVYDYTLRQLQRVACRYRGVGSPFSPQLVPCSAEELAAHYSKITKIPLKTVPASGYSFVDPYTRPVDAKSSHIVGTAWSQRVWRELQQDERKSQKRRPPVPTVPPPVDAYKVVNGRRVRPSLKEQADAAARMAALRIIVDAPVPPVSHTLWLAAPDSDEFMVPVAGLCMTAFMSNVSTTHAAFGAPWLQMLPNDVLEPHGSILLRDLTRRLERPRGNSMSKYLTNVRYTLAVDVHYPFLMAPYALLDEGRGLIDPERRNYKGVIEHEFGLHGGRRVSNHHYVTRSLEASVWKGVRQVLDDTGGGNARSSRSMLGVALGVDAPDRSAQLPPEEPQAIRDDSAWRNGRAFMLTVLFGPPPPDLAAEVPAALRSGATKLPGLSLK